MESKRNTKKTKRVIDEKIESSYKKLEKNFFLIGKKEIKAWQGVLVLAFVAGAAAALIFSAQTGIQNESLAKSKKISQLEQIKKAIRNGEAKWEAGNNKIFRLSNKEKKKLIGKLKVPTEQEMIERSLPSIEAGEKVTMLSSFDWRNKDGKNFVTPVKNQGDCASCWAFAAVGALESYRMINSDSGAEVLPGTQAIPDNSEQVLISCSAEVGLGNCAGGSVWDASSFLQNPGLPEESCYPYIAANGDCAKACDGWREKAVKIGSWGYIVGESYPPADDMKKALMSYGPIVTSMYIYDDFFSYSSGIYKHIYGANNWGGHTVLLVGYNDEEKYFIAKNSWGADWGENGFFRIAYDNGTEFGYRGNIAYAKASVKENKIVVVSPNGGEKLEAGSTISLKWKYEGYPGSLVNIYLFKTNVWQSAIAYTEDIGVGGSGAYNWTIPGYQPSGSDYQIRIEVNGNPNYFDVSDKYFTISNPNDCLEAGQVYQNASLGPNGSFGACCDGLSGIDGGLWDAAPNAASPICQSREGSGMICSNCGNGLCERWENRCNCSKDCGSAASENQEESLDNNNSTSQSE